MRELSYLDWLNEREEEHKTFTGRLQKLDNASYVLSRQKHYYAPTYNYKYATNNEPSYLNALRKGMIVYCLGAYLKMIIEEVIVQYPDDEEVEEWNGQKENEVIEHTRYATVKELRAYVGMSQERFSDYVGIPKRTIQNWEGGVSECPEYVLLLLSKKIYRDMDSYREYELPRKGLFKNIKELREFTGMTQNTFSKYLCVPKRTVSNWELGINACAPYTFNLIYNKVLLDFAENLKQEEPYK